MRQQQSHAEAGGHQESGSQLAKPAGPGEEPLETVGQTQDLPVEGSTNTWTISNKVLTNIRGRRRQRLGRGPAEKRRGLEDV